MWITFWPDVLVAVIGAILTVAIAFGTYLLEQRQKERRALEELITELHHRRSLARIEPREVFGAQEIDDFRFVSASISDIRQNIRDARRAIRPRSKSHAELSRMTTACNEYLESNQADPDNYQFYLVALRNAVTQQTAGIARRLRIKSLAPGGGAYDLTGRRGHHLPTA